MHHEVVRKIECRKSVEAIERTPWQCFQAVAPKKKDVDGWQSGERAVFDDGDLVARQVKGLQRGKVRKSALGNVLDPVFIQAEPG